MTRTLIVRLLVAALLVLPLGALAAPAGAAACSGTSGVTVVVQFPDGDIVVRCAPGDPSSGFDALARAGFDFTRVEKFPGALCRIDGVPDASIDPCQNMPPANAFWKYSYAEPGGTWIASNQGAGSRNPKPGTVEGWRYGDGAAPGIAPPGTRSTPATTAPATPKPTQPPRPSSEQTSAPATTGAAPSDQRSGSDPTARSPEGATPSGLPSPTSTVTPGADGTTAAPDPAESPVAANRAESMRRSSSLSPADGGLSWVWGVALLVALVGAGGATVLIRRRG